ncbi:MAG: hypothetical protein K8S62_06820 [Candidatus Sabulitectum sp.]|nr:hypothetical protein [Candidatus Sabulitectum sp.]
MAQVKNSEELRIRLQQAAGEDILAFGWGVLGMKNVFVALTPSAVFLEFISFTGNTKESRRIPFEELEFVYAIAGDASTPKLMKLNLESQITDAMTGTLLFKENTGKLTHILFRKMPNHDSNNKAPFRITEKLTAAKPELVHMPELKTVRKPQSKGGCMRRFAILTMIIAAVLTVVFAVTLKEGWGMASIIGFSTGVIFGGIFAPMIPIFRRMLTGQG